MAWSFIGSTSGTYGSIPAIPAGAAANDLILVTFEKEGAGVVVAPAGAGWVNAIPEVTVAGAPGIQSFWIKRGATAPSMAFVQTGVGDTAVNVLVMRPTGGNFAALAGVSGQSLNPANPRVTPSGVTTTVANSLVVGITGGRIFAGDTTNIKCAVSPSAGSTNAAVTTDPQSNAMSMYASVHFSSAQQAGLVVTAGIAPAAGDTGVLQFVPATGNPTSLGLTAFYEVSSGDVTPPTLTSPTATPTGSTTATGSVTTNESNGTLYRLATVNATETVATIKASGATSTVTATGVQSVAFTGLLASTTYYAHYVHRDAAGNDSVRSTSASFSTSSGVSGGEAITVTEKLQRQVIEGASGSASVTFSGTFSGSIEPIQVQIVDFTTGAVVLAWTALTTPTAAGAFSGTITVPRGGWYKFMVRKATTTTTTATSTMEWGVGVTVGIMGQSLAVAWHDDGGYYTTIDPRAVEHDGTAFQPMSGAIFGTGRINWALSLIALLNCPVCLTYYAVGGTALTSWWSGGKTAYYNVWDAKAAASGGKLSAFIWWQGNADASLGTPAATYLSGVRAMLSQIRSDYGPTLKVAIPILAGVGAAGSNDANWEAIRQAHIALGADANNGVVQAWAAEHNPATAEHLTSAGSTEVGKLLAHRMAAWFGNATATSTGPRITGVSSVSSTVVDVTLTHDKGTDFTPATGITAIELLDGSGVKMTLASAVRQSATVVRLTSTSVIAGTPTVRVHYGANPDISAPLRDNSLVTAPLVVPSNSAFVPPTTRTVILTLTTDGSAPAANLSGLKWAFFDQALPSSFGTPVAKGAGGATNASGAMTLDVAASSLSAGQTGWLVVTNSDGTASQTPAAKSFSGPVVVY